MKKSVSPVVMSRDGYAKVDFDNPKNVMHSLAPALGVIKPQKKTEDILKDKARCLIALDEKVIKAAIADRTRGFGVLTHPKFG